MPGLPDHHHPVGRDANRGDGRIHRTGRAPPGGQSGQPAAGACGAASGGNRDIGKDKHLTAGGGRIEGMLRGSRTSPRRLPAGGRGRSLMQALVTSGVRDEAGSPRRPHCRIVWSGGNRQTSHSIAGRSGAGERQSVAPASDSSRDCRLPTRRMTSANGMQSSSITPPMRRKLALTPKRSAIVPIIGGTTIDVNR